VEELIKKNFSVVKPNHTDEHVLQYLHTVDYLLENRSVYKDQYETEGIAVNRNKLAEYLDVDDRVASTIIRDLDNWFITTKVCEKQIGKSRTFRINPRFEDDHVSYKLVRRNSADFVAKLVKKYNDKLVTGCIMVRHQRRVLRDHITINDEGLNFLVNKYPFLKVLVEDYRNGKRGLEHFGQYVGFKVEPGDHGLISILLGRIWVSRPPTKRSPTTLSRLYSNLTGLKREYRKFLHLDGLPLMMTDIISCQMLRSAIAVENHVKRQRGVSIYKRSRQLQKYFDLALSGKFYEIIAKAAGHAETDRNIFKRMFFRSVFFSRIRGKADPKIKAAFRKMFPQILKWINQMKKNHHGAFAERLQKMEAQLILDGVYKQLKKEGRIALTLHDSIVVNNLEDLQKTEHWITELMLDKYGVSPKFKRE